MMQVLENEVALNPLKSIDLKLELYTNLGDSFLRSNALESKA